MQQETKRIIFDLPEDASFIETINAILANNGLAESDAEFLRKDKIGQEPRFIIVRDATIALFEKKLSEKKLTELLAKHLQTSKEVAEKIMLAVKEKLLPYMKKIPFAKEPAEEPAPAPVPEAAPPPPYAKKIEITNVEENAKATQKAKTVIQPEAQPKPQYQEKDPYKEPIE